MDEVHKWVDDKGGKILQQLRRLGASPDWSHQAYTMSPQLSNAVLEAFLRMHKAGLIYRDNRLVNWDTRLQSAVSDIEVHVWPRAHHGWKAHASFPVHRLMVGMHC